MIEPHRPAWYHQPQRAARANRGAMAGVLRVLGHKVQMIKTNELTQTERAFKLGMSMATGREYTTRRVAVEFGMSMRGARHLLLRVARVAPISRDDSGVWRLIER